jgi:hypothetical protein
MPMTPLTPRASSVRVAVRINDRLKICAADRKEDVFAPKANVED